MPYRAAFIATHIFSPAPSAKVTGTATSAGAGSLSDTGKNFVALGVQPGDVLRVTSGARKHAAVVIRSVTSITVVFYSEAAEPLAAGDEYRIEAPRQGEDLSADVLGWQLEDTLDQRARLLRLTLSNPDGKWTGRLHPHDPIEAWVDDDDPLTPSPSFPSGPSDTSADDDRCFVGRLGRDERDVQAQGHRLILTFYNYAADLLLAEADVVFRKCNLVKSPSPAPAGTYVADELLALLNGAPGSWPGTDTGDEARDGKLGRMRDRATGRPTFALAVTQAGLLGQSGVDVAFVREPFFDAFARLASLCSDANAGPFNGEPCRLLVDDLTYHPRRQDRAGSGEDDPRPPAGANPGAGNPTIRIQTPTELAEAAAWSVVEGDNLLGAAPLEESERTRNAARLLGTRADEVPIVIEAARAGSSEDAFGQLLLGQDRYGRLEGSAQVPQVADTVSAQAAADAGMVRSAAAKARRVLQRPLVVEVGRSAAGLLLTPSVPSAGLQGLAQGIVTARHSVEAAGMVTTLDLTNPRPGWDRLLAPLQKSVGRVVKEDAWQAWRLLIADVAAGNPGTVTVKQVNPAAYGDAAAERTLFTITAPSTTTYPTSTGTGYSLIGFRWLDGLLLLVWTDGDVVAPRILFQLRHAKDGAPWLPSLGNGDGIYSTMQSGGARITAEVGPFHSDVDFFSIQEDQGAGLDPAALTVWVLGSSKAQFFVLDRDALACVRKDTALSLPVPTFLTAYPTMLRGFVRMDDAGKTTLNAAFAETFAGKTTWGSIDLGNASAGWTKQTEQDAGKRVYALTATRDDRGLASYVKGDFNSPFGNQRLFMSVRWGEKPWQREVGQGVRAASDGLTRAEVIPLTRFVLGG